MKNSVLFCLLSFILFISSCNKKPAPDFSTDKPTYAAGEVIRITNTSENASDYEWTFQDQVYTGNIQSITVSLLYPDGNYTLQLKAFSKKKNKTDVFSKILQVKSVKGSLAILGSAASTANFLVTIDNQDVGQADNN